MTKYFRIHPASPFNLIETNWLGKTSESENFRNELANIRLKEE